MFKKPNYTQVPNEFFDELLPTLKEGELRVLVIIMRQTFGWGNKEWDRISITQLMKKTGMERMAVVRATKTLVEKKLVVKHKEGPKGREQCWYSLMVEQPTEFSNPIDNSNNSDQYPKDTPPSIFRIPTKETLTKERKESSLKGAKEKSASPPTPDGFYKGRFEGKIHVSQENMERLLKKFQGEQTKIDLYAEKLYRYSIQRPAKFRQYKRHDMVIEDWIEKDSQKFTASQSLSESQRKNWDLNQKIVEKMKDQCPRKTSGLYFYYKDFVLRDKNKDSLGNTFDISGLVDSKIFVSQLEKHFKMKIPVLGVNYAN